MAEGVDNRVGTGGRRPRLPSDLEGLGVLTLLNERPSASADEVADALGIARENAFRQLEALQESGLVETFDEPAREEGAEIRYRALARSLWSDEEWATLSFEEQRRLTAWIVQLINSDVGEALRSGSFNSRADTHASRTVSLVDEQGWKELARIQEGALEASFAVQAASAERLAESGEKGIAALSAMLCFELPPRRRRGRPD